jgi:hypothetical protein
VLVAVSVDKRLHLSPKRLRGHVLFFGELTSAPSERFCLVEAGQRA